MLAIDKLRRRYLGVTAGADEELVVGGERAGRVCAAGIAGQRKGLATAAAPIDLAPLAGAARLRHPSGAAKSRKRR